MSSLRGNWDHLDLELRASTAGAQRTEWTGEELFEKVSFPFGRKKEAKPIGTFAPMGEDETALDDSVDAFYPDDDEEDDGSFIEEYEFVDRSLNFTPPDPNESVEELAKQWREKKDPFIMEKIMAHMGSTLNHEINQVSQFRLPRPMLKGRVFNSFAKSVDSWDPERSNLRTYFRTNTLRNERPKLLQAAQFAQVPQRLGQKTKPILTDIEEYEDKIGRTATNLELIEQPSIKAYFDGDQQLRGKSKAQRVRTLERIRKGAMDDHLGSKVTTDPSAGDDSLDRIALERVRDSLSPRDQKILDRLFGIRGFDPMTSRQVSDDLKVDQSTVSATQKVIVQRWQKRRQMLATIHG